MLRAVVSGQGIPRDREFTSEDYDILSQLDAYPNSQTTEKI